MTKKIFMFAIVMLFAASAADPAFARKKGHGNKAKRAAMAQQMAQNSGHAGAARAHKSRHGGGYYPTGRGSNQDAFVTPVGRQASNGPAFY